MITEVGAVPERSTGDDAYRYPGEVHRYDLPDDDAELEDEWPEAKARTRRLPRALWNLTRERMMRR